MLGGTPKRKVSEILEKYGESVEIITEDGFSKDYQYTKGFIDPLYHSNKPYKPLTDYQKEFFRLVIPPNIFTRWFCMKKTTVICNGEKYEVKKINEYKVKNEILYKWAVLRRIQN